MKLYYKTKLGKLYQGDAVDAAKLKEEAQCLITSPPYWGQRNYGVDSQLGIEDSPESYIKHLANIIESVGSIVKNTGIIWVNIGDTYKASGSVVIKQEFTNAHGKKVEETYIKPQNNKHEYIQPKSLVGIPWRFAFEMQKRKWLIRQENIWYKRNPQPESVKDRLTNAHEHIFMFTKTQKYFFNHKASLEKTSGKIYGVSNKLHGGSSKYVEQTMMRKGSKQCYYTAEDGTKLRHGRDVWEIPLKPNKHSHIAPFPLQLVKKCIRISTKENDVVIDPFIGSGTTAIAAEMLNRRWIGIELKTEYCEIIKKRLQSKMNTLFV
jgi:DNA modification methylase